MHDTTAMRLVYFVAAVCYEHTAYVRTCIRDLMASSGKETIHKAQPPRPPDMNVLKESVKLGSQL